MKYLKTKKATNWSKEKSYTEKLVNMFLFFIPKANPDYEGKMHLLKTWLIEFVETDGDFLPWREIALDENDCPVFAGPDKYNYGFWCDMNMKFEDFEGTLIDKSEFERFWKKSGVKELRL